MVWYRTTFILHYEPEPHLIILNYHATHALYAPRTGGKISNNFHCAFSADGALTRPPGLSFEGRAGSSSALISAEPPHRRRDCLSEIESLRLRAPAQILDLALEADWHLERSRFAFLPAF
jgi:hypothetical protein